MSRATAVPEMVTIHVPFRIVKRGGRKEMQLLNGASLPRWTDNTPLKALAQAFRWKRMLESGEFASISELAECEGIAPSYMTRVLRLTLLAPDVVEAILDGGQGPKGPWLGYWSLSRWSGPSSQQPASSWKNRGRPQPAPMVWIFHLIAGKTTPLLLLGITS